MLTLEEAAALLASVTYKPGSRLELHYSDKKGWLAEIHLWVRAEQRPQISDMPEPWDSDTVIHSQRSLNRYGLKNPKRFLDEVATILKTIECHEALEWMMVDGLRVYDPHLDPKHFDKRVELVAANVLGTTTVNRQDAGTWMSEKRTIPT